MISSEYAEEERKYGDGWIEEDCPLCKYSDMKGLYYCKLCFQHRVINKKYMEIDQISEKVYLGNEEGAAHKQRLKEIGITHILICGADLVKFYEDDFKYKHITIEDEASENIKKYFREAISFIESGKKVYVHCWAGVSRSASFVIAYFMWKEKLSFDNAFKLVVSKRDCINPNEGFIKQLKQFEEFLTKNNYSLKEQKKKK